MKPLILASVCVLASAIGANVLMAEPVCREFSTPSQMPKKYRKYAPVLSNGPDGWLITEDQMDTNYLPKQEPQTLLALIAAEFEQRGLPLAILMAPPRPLIAGPEELKQLGADEGFDTEDVAASFSAMIETVRSAGIIAPDLLSVATSDPALQERFYFRRDTHWTPEGAARSAIALADELAKTHADRFKLAGTITASDLTQGQEVKEKGSLSSMAKKVCGLSLEPEIVPTFTFPANAGGLLDTETSDKPRIALAGSSFSDRYQRDFYRVADSLAGALGADVENYSVSGGGPIGGIESLVLSGKLSPKHFDLIIWELPYTEGLASTHFLRQLLGALRYDPTVQGDEIMPVKSDTKKVDLPIDPSAGQTLVVSLPDSDTQKVTIDLHRKSGKTKSIKLQRKNRVPAEIRSHIWAVSLDALKTDEITKVSLVFPDGAPGAEAKVTTLP